MSSRLTRKQRQDILAAMMDEARCCTTEMGLPLPEVVKAVGQLRNDMVSAYRQGFLTITPVPQQSRQEEKDE